MGHNIRHRSEFTCPPQEQNKQQPQAKSRQKTECQNYGKMMQTGAQAGDKSRKQGLKNNAKKSDRAELSRGSAARAGAP